MTVSLLLVDDHVVFVETLAAALSGVDGLDVAAVATTASDALAQARDLHPDVALVDIDLPDFGGIELARRMGRVSPETRVIVLTASEEPSALVSAMDAGVSGYLVKHAALREVTGAIREVHAGRMAIPAALFRKLVTAPTGSGPAGAVLTRREREVLALLAQGCDVQRIAKLLGITWHTARSYVKTLLLKLDAHSQLEAVSKARRLGLLDTTEGSSER